MSSDYSVNPAAPYQLYQVGPEAEPMILVDGALAYPRSIVDHAASDGVYGPAPPTPVSVARRRTATWPTSTRLWRPC